MQYFDSVTKKAMDLSCLRNNFGSNRRTYSGLDNINIPVFVTLNCLLPFEICICRDILPSFCLVRICTSTSNQYTIRSFAGLPHVHVKFLLLVEKKF